MNHYIINGALSRIPELRYTPSGIPVFEGVVAGERPIIDRDGNQRFIPFYSRFQVMGKYAEVLSERNLQAGQLVQVSGTLEENKWENETTGKHSDLARV